LEVKNVVDTAREEGIDIGIEKGIDIGMEKGREEGIDIGEQTAVLALLKSKFGVLNDWEQEQAKRLVSEIGLEATIARILTAQSVAEVFGGDGG
jgi:flagellar biosynthesis/type III secretory pathway protein FliH